jgi:hypothetical protein
MRTAHITDVRGETCPIATFSTTNPTWTDLVLSTGHVASSRLNYCKAQIYLLFWPHSLRPVLLQYLYQLLTIHNKAHSVTEERSARFKLALRRKMYKKSAQVAAWPESWWVLEWLVSIWPEHRWLCGRSIVICNTNRQTVPKVMRLFGIRQNIVKISQGCRFEIT